MDIKEAEALKVKILERRNYLSSLDLPSTYSKRNLHGGMQNRVRRKEDRVFKKEVLRQKGSIKQDISAINEYIFKLNEYNIPSSDSDIETLSVKVAPIIPKVTFSKKPVKNKSSSVRINGRGIGSRRRLK